MKQKIRMQNDEKRVSEMAELMRSDDDDAGEKPGVQLRLMKGAKSKFAKKKND
jgi:hypothetical protein